MRGEFMGIEEDSSPATSSGTISVGGKGWTLSSEAVYAVSHGKSKVEIADSALSRLSRFSWINYFRTRPLPPVSVSSAASPPRRLSVWESRAALVVVLSKLLHADSRGVRTTLPLIIAEALNDGAESERLERLDFGSVTAFLTSLCGSEDVRVTADEVVVVEEARAVAVGKFAVIDCMASTLSGVMDAVAALSCEAIKAEVRFGTYLAYGDEERAGVAEDMSMMLFRSELIGMVDSRICREIPAVHGIVRNAVKMLRLQSRMDLNSVVKTTAAPIPNRRIINNGPENSYHLDLLALRFAKDVCYAGESSLHRIVSISTLVADADLKSKLVAEIQDQFSKIGFSGIYDAMSPVDDPHLHKLFDQMYFLFNDGDLKSKLVPELWNKYSELQFLGDQVFYSMVTGFRVLGNSAYSLVLKLQELLAWEAAITLFVIEMDDEINAGNYLKDQKKKKRTLGKGTCILRQVLKDHLQVKNEKPDVAILAQWAKKLASFFDPNNAGLDELIKRMKEKPWLTSSSTSEINGGNLKGENKKKMIL